MLASSGKLTIVGPNDQLARAAALLGEIDPGAASDKQPAQAERRALTMRLKFVSPQVIEGLGARLLTPRQLASVKFYSGGGWQEPCCCGADGGCGGI